MRQANAPDVTSSAHPVPLRWSSKTKEDDCMQIPTDSGETLTSACGELPNLCWNLKWGRVTPKGRPITGRRPKVTCCSLKSPEGGADKLP